MSYDKTKIKNQENCNCKECISVKNTELENQTVEYPKLSEEEIERIINEIYSYKDEKTKTFIRKALKVHSNRYDYSNVIYVKNKVYVEIICKVEGHKPFPQKPNNHLNGSGCPLCARIKQSLKQTLTLDEFIERANKKHGEGTYDYSKVKYVNCDTEVIIICHNHEEPYEFKQTPSKHLLGHGCPICGVQKRAKERALSLSEFIEKANKKHGEGTYDYSESEYINSKTPLIIICPKHGKFKQTPNTHLRGSGCFKCNKYKGEIAIRNFLIKNQIEFEEQKKFEGCEYKRQLKFDFYLPKHNLCIEFDGEQHFKPHDFSSKLDEKEKKKNLKLVQYRDQIKNDYCKNNGINLLRIRYDENVEEKLTEYFQNHKIIKEQMIFDLVS